MSRAGVNAALPVVPELADVLAEGGSMSQATLTRTCVAPPTSGPITGYRTHGCRCYRCSAASTAYERQRRDSIKAGTWCPAVDAKPVIDHLAKLKKAGIGSARAALAAGLDPAAVVKYVPGGGRPLPKRIRTETAEALLKVTVHAAKHAGARVPALGSQRRARALSAIGWSMQDQAARLGIPQTAYTSSINRAEISSRRAAQIADMYERLSGTPGKSSRARAHARRHGWASPLAWDDVDINDPHAQPCRTRRRRPVHSNDLHPLTESEAA